MFKPLKFIFPVALSLLLPSALLAGNPDEGRRPLSVSAEFMGGPSLLPSGVKGVSGSSVFPASGGSVTFRLSCGLQDGFGVFAQIRSVSMYSDEAAFFGAMNKADGEKYLYRFSGYGDYSAGIDPVFTAGVSKRWDFGSLALVPHLGIGLGQRYIGDYGYERRSRDGSTGPEYFTYERVGKKSSADYLIDDYYTYEYPAALILTADFQVSWRMDRRLYLFVQPGFDWAPGSLDMKRTEVSSKLMYSPSNWAEAVAYSDAKDQWMRDQSSSTDHFESRRTAPMFHLEFGIGINFGHRK